MDLTRSLADVYSHGGVVGSSRNLKCYLSAASATATWTADELTLSTGLGQVPTRIGNVNLTINLATVGANGMDTGTAPVSGFVGVYVIYNFSAQTAALLATNATSAAVSEVYSGANMPAGYTASALIGVWPTNSSSQFVAGLSLDRTFYYQTAVAIFTGVTGVSTMTVRSVAAGVPFNAHKTRIAFGTTNTSVNPVISIAGDSTGMGCHITTLLITSATHNVTSGIPAQAAIGMFDVSLLTPQTVYWMDSNNSGGDSMYITGFVF